VTRTEAEAYVRSCGEDEGPDGDDAQLRELFAAIYGRAPDADDESAGLWDLICAGVAS